MEQHRQLITWYVLFAITQVTTLVLVLIDNNTLADRLTAAGLLCLNGVWFLLYG
ncbi:MAG: hypothetical protein QOF58_3583, partial [Pseudonocardiales bacterium]|nr:hypothetical protein [Pseudonocardiales bacterium]